MFTDDSIHIRPFHAPPRELPDAVPRFFVGDGGTAMVEIKYHRNPFSTPIRPVTQEIAAEFPDEWAAFVAAQEAIPSE